MTEIGHGDFSIGSDVWPGTSKLLEEMGELTQVLGKLMGTGGRVEHWDGSDLRERLIEELADLEAAVDFFRGENLTRAENDVVARRIEDKLALFRRWHEEKTTP